MRYTSLDNITRSYLLQKGYSLHWYLQALKYAADGLRELTFDSLRVVNTIRLPLNDYNAVDIPCDYVDMIKLGVQVGQYVQPLVKKGTINRLTNTNDEGQPIPYGDQAVDTDIFLPGAMGIYWGTVMWNENNEHLGRFFGLRGDYGNDTYKIIPERNQIQLDERLIVEEVVLEYISDGQTVTNASQVNPYAIKTIEAYIDWQFKLWSRTYSDGERREAERRFDREHKRLRSRLNNLTVDDIKRSYTSNYTATIKA